MGEEYYFNSAPLIWLFVPDWTEMINGVLRNVVEIILTPIQYILKHFQDIKACQNFLHI